jgi:hypothetical protein
MNSHKPAIWTATLAGGLGACLLIAAPAPAAGDAAITGKLDRGGLTVVALTPHGAVSRARAKPAFRLVPRARTVTLHIRDHTGAYLGPLVVAGRDGRVTLGVRAGAKLGLIDVRDGYARVSRRPASRSVDGRVTARARRGKPIGAGVLGWVKGRKHGGGAAGTDPDRDGIPNKFDVDDDGDLVPDVRERPATGRLGGEAPGASLAAPLGACPAALCSGRIGVDVSDADRADVALIVAIAAAVLAAVSLGWQLLGIRRRRRRRVEVDVRLGLPIYPQGGGDWSVFVEVRNGTDHPVRWVSASLELGDGRRLYLMQQPAGGELPVVLQPHDSHQTWAPCRILEQGGLELTETVVATAKLDSGEVLPSPRRRLVARSLVRRRRR